MNGITWQSCYATLMSLTSIRRCRGACLLRCIRAYDWPPSGSTDASAPSSATWWWVSPPVDGKPEAGQGEHHDAEGIGGCRTVCQRVGEQRQQLPVLEEQAGPAGRAGHPDHGRATLIAITLAVLPVLQAGCHSPRLGRLGVMELRQLRYFVILAEELHLGPGRLARAHLVSRASCELVC